MCKVGIIGGGASGLVAAICAKRKGNEVTILEKNSDCGKKILVTGNGRCNYFNEDFSIKHYNSKSIDNLKSIITEENKDKILTFFDSIGIVSKIKNGYYYPYSNQASSIKNALITEANIIGVNIINDFNVIDIEKENEKFKVKSENNTIYFDKLVLSCGSKASPKTGSTGDGYVLAKKFGHTITDIYPALVQLRGEEKFFKKWSGVRADANVKLYIDDDYIKEEFGEIMLTDYGVSGICIFNLSSNVKRSLENNKKVSVVINFVSFLNLNNAEEFVLYIEEKNKRLKNRTINDLFEGIINYKLINALIDKKDLFWDNLSYDEKLEIAKKIYSLKINIIDTNSFDQAQVCSGGVSLNEIDMRTMESKIEKNLFIIGELLDVDGECGGYNLGFAWLSGIIAGNSMEN